MEVYLHIPFCHVKCAYCALHSFAGRDHFIEPYVAALEREIRCMGAGQRVETVYFGGGTPSLLTARQVETLLAACAQVFSLADDAEITMEAHPATVSLAYLRDLRALGVNRLSFGVQSAHDDTLRRVGRAHTVAEAARALAWARAAGFGNAGVDLIYGLPGESLARWRASLARALAWEPDHVSAYALAVEPGTALARRVEMGQETVADADWMAEMYDVTTDLLAAGGLRQYEISNWARPGLACRHNLGVWRGGEYIGLGAGAHGYVNGVRYEVIRDLEEYIRRVADPEPVLTPADRGFKPSVRQSLSRPSEPRLSPLTPAAGATYPLSEREMMEEAMILGLRLVEEGVSAGRFAARFGRDLWDAFGPELDALLALGLLERHGDAVRLTPRARLVSNQVFVRFVSAE